MFLSLESFHATLFLLSKRPIKVHIFIGTMYLNNKTENVIYFIIKNKGQ